MSLRGGRAEPQSLSGLGPMAPGTVQTLCSAAAVWPLAGSVCCSQREPHPLQEGRQNERSFLLGPRNVTTLVCTEDILLRDQSTSSPAQMSSTALHLKNKQTKILAFQPDTETCFTTRF